MKPSNNVIAFPVATAAGNGQQRDDLSSTTPAVIDFVDRREAANAKARAAMAEQPGYQLTAGEIWDALNDDRLVMHYQPQYDMRTGKMIGAEALTRLIDTDGQLIYPDRFIDLLEQSDLIVWLGRSVIERVCADLAICRAEGFAITRMAINLSARQLNIDTGLLDFIDQMVDRYALDYSDLEFELTERQSLTPHCDGLSVLDRLAARGSRIVIDDFGIGYSSIVYLAELPISAFKLDRALINRLPENKAMQTLVESLLTLADSLDLEVVAEGIETNAQNDYLIDAGCGYAQGFGYAKPMPIDELQIFMIRAAADNHGTTQFNDVTNACAMAPAAPR